MEANRTTRAIRILGAMVGGGLFVLGLGELLVRLDDPAPLAFWLPTLWGGSFFILFGVFGRSVTPRNSQLFVILGAVLGLLPTVWTVIMPILSIALVVLMIRLPGKSTAARTN